MLCTVSRSVCRCCFLISVATFVMVGGMCACSGVCRRQQSRGQLVSDTATLSPASAAHTSLPGPLCGCSMQHAGGLVASLPSTSRTINLPSLLLGVVAMRVLPKRLCRRIACKPERAFHSCEVVDAASDCVQVPCFYPLSLSVVRRALIPVLRLWLWSESAVQQTAPCCSSCATRWLCGCAVLPAASAFATYNGLELCSVSVGASSTAAAGV